MAAFPFIADQSRTRKGYERTQCGYATILARKWPHDVTCHVMSINDRSRNDKSCRVTTGHQGAGEGAEGRAKLFL